MFTEAFSSVEYLLAVGAAPREPLFMELLLMRLPIRFRFQRLVTECTREVLWSRRRGGGDGRKA